ncbi:MAG: pentapeptide repeat-containing protein [Nitrospira sp.]|nr:pentapeptide repeat-containing protein [Nitrospira sp.]
MILVVLATLVLVQTIALIAHLWPKLGNRLPFSRPNCDDQYDGQYKGGTKPSDSAIKQMLEKHSHWLQIYSTKELRLTTEALQDSRRANLCGADLSALPAGIFKRADLTGANLTLANFSRVNLSGAILDEVDFGGANFAEAIMDFVKLEGVITACPGWQIGDPYCSNFQAASLRSAKIAGILWGISLHKAILEFADLRGSSLLDVDLSDAYLQAAKLSHSSFIDVNFTAADLRSVDLEGSLLTRVNFSRAKFQPWNVSDSMLISSEGLSTIEFDDPRNLVKLRNRSKEFGLRNEQKALTAALRKFATDKDTPFERFLQAWIFGGWITDYGAKPIHSIVGLIILTPIFGVFYYIGLLRNSLSSNIWKIWRTENVNGIANRSLRITEGLGEPSGQYFLLFCWSCYFSLLSAFHIGWRDLNVGSWISRLQFDDYTLRATGWIRAVSGVQSLISVYLLALWLLTHFGSPFE